MNTMREGKGAAPGTALGLRRGGVASDVESSPTRRQFVMRTAALGLLAATWGTAAQGADRGRSKRGAATELVSPGRYGRYDVLGPLLEFFTPADDCPDYASMLGTLPPKYAVPLHSHPDDESFFLISGTMQALMERRGKFEWFDVPPAGFVHVPKNARHAWRNTGDEPVTQVILTSARLGQFFREAGRPLALNEQPQPPTPEAIQRFTHVARNYGHWLATPEENAAVGIVL